MMAGSPVPTVFSYYLFINRSEFINSENAVQPRGDANSNRVAEPRGDFNS